MNSYIFNAKCLSLKMKKIISLFLLVFFNTFIAYSQLEINAALRPRGEIKHGYAKLPETDDKSACFIAQRTRIKSIYTKEKMKFAFSLQDVRVWGDENVSSSGIWGGNTESSLDVYESYAQMTFDKFSFKIGRQELSYDDERILAKRNRNNYGLTYNALLLKYELSDFQVDLGLSYNNDAASNYATPYIYTPGKIRTLNFLYLKKKVNENTDISVINLITGYQKDSAITDSFYFKNTLGTNFNYQKNKLIANLTAYYQFGQNVTATDVNAYLLATYAGLKNKKMTLQVGFDILSGHDITNTNSNYVNTDHSFDIINGARFKYYGFLNLFTNPQCTKNGGLIDLHTKNTVSLNKKINVNLHYHYFMLQQKVIEDESDAQNIIYYEKFLAHEIDTKLTWNIADEITLTGGYSFMMPSNSMKKIQNVSGNCFANYFWIMIRFAPKFIIETKKI